MAEISRSKPSDVTAFMKPKGTKGADLYTLDESETTFRDVVHKADEAPKNSDIKKHKQSDSKTMRHSSTRDFKNTKYTSQEKPTIQNVEHDTKEAEFLKEDKKESHNMIPTGQVSLQVIEVDPKNTQIIVPLTITKNDTVTVEDELNGVLFDNGVLSDLNLIERKETDKYKSDHYTVDADATEALLPRDKPEFVVFANELQITYPKQKNVESESHDEVQNQTTRLNVQPVQPGISGQDIHENTKHHVIERHPNSTQSKIELTAEEQMVVDRFVQATAHSDSTKSRIYILPTYKEMPQAEMKRLLVVPIQLSNTIKSEDAAYENSQNSTNQIDTLSNASTERTDNGNQESMNFSQFSGSSSDMKNMAENSKVSTHNLVSTNPAAEFIETLKQNFKQFSKVQTSKLTVQMRHSGKNLTIHFNTDADHVMNVTFRTTDEEWKNMLQEHSQEIEGVFENSNHTVKIKYLGE